MTTKDTEFCGQCGADFEGTLTRIGEHLGSDHDGAQFLNYGGEDSPRVFILTAEQIRKDIEHAHYSGDNTGIYVWVHMVGHRVELQPVKIETVQSNHDEKDYESALWVIRRADTGGVIAVFNALIDLRA